MKPSITTSIADTHDNPEYFFNDTMELGSDMTDLKSSLLYA